MINPRTKGATAEREIADDLNFILYQLRNELGIPHPDKPVVQRNQNQSAVGGCDLIGTYGLAIEVKRQELLSINTWWAQCAKSANELKEMPVLLFRQNAKPGVRTQWRCILLVELPIYGSPSKSVRAEIGYDEFKAWFKDWTREHLRVDLQITGTPLPVEPEVAEAPVRVREPDLYAED